MNDALDRSLPDSDLPTSVPDAVASSDPSSDGRASAPDETTDAETDASDLADLPEVYRDALRRLRDRITEAADTIAQLRAENEQLRERIQELEKRPVLPDDKAVLTLDDDPEALRSRVTDFIDAIDAYLDATAPEEEAENEPAPDAD